MEHSSLNETESLNGTFSSGQIGVEETIKKSSGFSLFMDLLSGACVPDNLWRDRMFRVKYAVRTLLHPLDTLKVLNKMASEPVWQEAFSIQTKLPSKIHKPYLHLGLPSAGRADALVDHYDFVKSLENVQMRNTFLSEKGNTVTQFTGKDGEAFRVVLGSIGKSEREGEANMFLYMEDTLLAALTFSIVQRSEGPTMIVGGFQGAHRSTPHEVIKQATKSCYGLFPKRLLLEPATFSAACATVTARKMCLSPIITNSGIPSARRRIPRHCMTSRWNCRANRWKRLPVRNVPNIANVTRCSMNCMKAPRRC